MTAPPPRPSQVPLMGLIELVRGLQTSDETFEATQRLATHLGKTTCVSLVSERLCSPHGQAAPAPPTCLPAAGAAMRSNACVAHLSSVLHLCIAMQRFLCHSQI